MYNADNPFGYEPPSSGKLLRSTLLAAGIAAVLLVTVVLPAEYGIDPTGFGAAVGLKRMGEIKVQLADEAVEEEAAMVRAEAELVADDAAAADAELAADDDAAASLTPATGPAPEKTAAGTGWRDEVTVVLAADEAAEYKLVMEAGAVAEYSWVADGGALNFNAHGHGGGQAVEYAKGRAAPTGEGDLTAAFDGYHGWFWRNRSGNTVTLTLRTRGDYSELKRTI